MNLFLVGAGFTKACFPNAPLNCNLLDLLFAQLKEPSARVLCDRYNTQDIEIALTRLDMDIAESINKGIAAEEDRKLRLKITAALANYFSNFYVSREFIKENKWLVRLLKIFESGDVAISLNYDCVLEGLLDCCGKWSPIGGYGYPFENPLFDRRKFVKSPITVLKIHGSANFRAASYVDKPVSEAVNFEFNEDFFPQSGKNTNFLFGAGMERPYLIIPSYVKIPAVEIYYSMINAIRASEKAHNLVIIGSALRPEDSFLTLIITNFLRHKTWEKRRIIIVDPKASIIAERLRRYWGVNVEKQIVQIDGVLEDSAERLARLIMKFKRLWPKKPRRR